MAPAALLEVVDLACRRGGRTVFDRLSFTLADGEAMVLAGRNGSGKTTLLRALALLLPADSGQIRWQGADVRGDRDAWRSRLAWLGHLDGLKGDLSVRENLQAAEAVRGVAAPHDHVDAALVDFGLLRLAARPVRSLSAGQRRRTALARVVVARVPLWLLDEPFNALDDEAQRALRSVLQRHLAGGGLALAASHVELGLPQARTLQLGAP